MARVGMKRAVPGYKVHAVAPIRQRPFNFFSVATAYENKGSSPAATPLPVDVRIIYG